MNAELISVGTELLLGNIVNTNVQYLSRRLADMGINVYRHTVVGDNHERFLGALEEAFEKNDLVITTGGLGPTKDDLTKEAAANYFNKKLVLHEKSLAAIREYFSSRLHELNEGNIKQAYFPEGSIVLENNYGTAPGCIIEGKQRKIILLPGPPKEMKEMFEASVVPYLMKFQDSVLVSKTLRIFGIGESVIAEKIQNIIEKQSNPTVAPYAKDSEVTLRLTARAKDQSEGLALIEPVENSIREIFGDSVYGTDETGLPEVTLHLLEKKYHTISVAESCTGGLISSMIVSCPGASHSFIEGAVTYSNRSKIKRLGVKTATIERYGSVSKEVAAEMAEGIARTSGTDIGISTTGIAGPEGGSEEKPVGLVYIGIYIDGKTRVQKLNLTGNREKIRSRAAFYALDILRRELLKHE